MNSFKKIFVVIGLLLAIMLGEAFAADPSFNIVPATGTALKLHCDYDFNMYMKAGAQVYNAFDSTIKFDDSNITLTHSAIQSPFTDYASGFIKNSNLYRMYGNMPAGQSSSADRNASIFHFKTKNNITSTTLQFTDIDGNVPTFGGAGTADGEYIIGVNAGGADILTAVYDASYSFFPLPCVIDVDNPKVSNIVPATNSFQVPSSQTISFIVYDWMGAGSVGGTPPLATNNRQHYWYQGLTTTLGNYVSAPSTVDNQEGINSGTIKVTIQCPTCSDSSTYVRSGSQITVTTWTGSASQSPYTWNSKDRGYVVSVPAPISYDVEKAVNVTIEAYDNPNELSATHQLSWPITFNAFQNPLVSFLNPTNGQTFINPLKSNTLVFKFNDTWAGIDTNSIKITIPTIMSGTDQLLTGYTYSGTQLTYILSGGSAGLGNAGGYEVRLAPIWDMPANRVVTVTGSFADLANNTNTFSMSYTTRPDCSYFGCSEILNVNILGGTNIGVTQFTGAILVITGTNPNSPYPYLTGVNNDTVMCGIPYAGATLSGNFAISSSTGADLRGTTYTSNKLYITGLNFTVSGGLITVQ